MWRFVEKFNDWSVNYLGIHKVMKCRRVLYKAHISRYDGRWLVQYWDEDLSGVLYKTFREACDRASYQTFLALQRAGIKQ